MTTISNGTTTLTLPADLLRRDEYAYSPVRQAATPTLTGAVWIDVSVASAGEPITLAGGREGGNVFGTMTRAEFAALRALADVPGASYTLVWQGTPRTVVFRHNDTPALDAEPVTDYSDPSDADDVIPTIKMMVI